MTQELLIAKITYKHNEESYCGPFNSLDDYEDWALITYHENQDEIESIEPITVYQVSLGLARLD